MAHLSKTRPVIIITFFAILGSIALWFLITPVMKGNTKIMPQAATLFPSQKPLPTFQLTDTKGLPFTNQSFRGQWTLLFFGYHTCKDICPTTLSILKEVWNQFPPEQTPARMIFANITEGTHELPLLTKFLNQFNPKFIGITGPKEEMEKLKRPLGIFAQEVQTETGEIKIDHSSTLMLINPKGQLHAIFSPPFDSSAIAFDLKLITKG